MSKNSRLYRKAKVIYKNEDDEVRAYNDWDVYFDKITSQEIVKDAAYNDERLKEYKGVFNRMGQGHLNDPLQCVAGDEFKENLFDIGKMEFGKDINAITWAEDESPDAKRERKNKYMEELCKFYAYSGKIDAIDPTDPDYIMQKRYWRKDKPHFDHKILLK